MIRALLLGAVALIVVLAATTWAALETGGVAIAQTRDPDDGTPRQTHIWFVRDDDRIWLEAGHPSNPWVTDLAAGSALTLQLEGQTMTKPFHMHSANSHAGIRARMRAKYGWRDRWVTALFDVSESVAIEFGPAVRATAESARLRGRASETGEQP
ncbi:MAG: hypothetical protein AAGI15_15080 [Pseudomonadota bacterium]